MSTNSLQTLLAKMKQVDVMFGWGAISVFGRQQLNRLLAQQFVEGLHAFRIITPLSGQFYLDDARTESVELERVMLGQPQISFGSSSQGNSTATLTLNLIAGKYTTLSQPPGAPEVLISSFDLSESLGYTLQMEIDLAPLVGEVDCRGRVTIDLAAGRDPRCNLASQTLAQEKIGRELQEHLQNQPGNTRTYELSLLDFNGYNPLSPVAFYIRTQPAPGDDPDDGAVVVFIRLKGKDENGSLPLPGSEFPYLIPDDREGSEALYSASLVLAADLVDWADEEQLDVLKNLLFPGQNVFDEVVDGRHQPRDLLVLGNIRLAPEAATLETMFAGVKPGKTQQFVARRGNGSVISNAQWSVSYLDSPLSAGSISQSGVYTAPTGDRMGRDFLPTVVTARYLEDGHEQVASAMLLSRFEGMSITPRATTVSVGRNTPVSIKASSLIGGALEWRLLEPGLGELKVLADGQASYTAPATTPDRITLQKIECKDKLSGETIESAIVLVRELVGVRIDPPFVPSIAASSQLHFTTDEPPEDFRWRVIGEGTIDEYGVFTPPAFATSLISVVVGEVMRSGSELVRAQGIAVVQLSERQEDPPRWDTLEAFTLSPQGGLTQCYANGLQQIPLVIKIETKPHEGLHIPVSDVELSTLRLVDKLGGELPVIDNAQDGIEYGSPHQCAMHERRNRFNLYSPNGSTTDARQALPSPQNSGIRYREVFVHMATQGARTFYATFQGDDGRFWTSSDIVIENHEIELSGVRIPTPDPVAGPNRDYDLVRKRAFNGPGHTEGEDDFSFYMSSVDYWHLSYRRLGAYLIPFATLKIEQNVSTIQWESEQIYETGFSYTGYGFYPMRFANSDAPPAQLSFDPYFKAFVKQVDASPIRSAFENNTGPAPGELIVSLHRDSNTPFWDDDMAGGNKNKLYRELLDPPVIYVLLDAEGNRHRLQIGFAPPTLLDSRNTLLLNLR